MRDLSGLSPDDAQTLERLLGGEQPVGERAERMAALLGLLGRWQADAPPPGLGERVFSSVLASQPVSLSVEDGRALDALLALRERGLTSGPMPAGAAERAQRVGGVLSLLDRATGEPVPEGLAGRTMQAIERDRADQAGRLLLSSAQGVRHGRGPGISIRQIATTAALLMMVLSVLVPMLDKAQRDAMIARCGENLAGLGLDLAHFAEDNKGSTLIRSTAPAPTYAKPSDGLQVPATGRNLVILLNTNRFESDHLLCPASNEPGTGVYNGQNPIAGGPLRLLQYHDRPVFADTNPLYRMTPTGLVRITELPGMTRSKNHDGLGQNVLFGDGSVRWMLHPAVQRSADQSDNIWLLQESDEAGGPDVFLTP